MEITIKASPEEMAKFLACAYVPSTGLTSKDVQNAIIRYIDELGFGDGDD